MSDDREFTRGWRVVAGGVIGIAAGVSSLYFYSLGLFLKPLAASYGWSRGEASLGPLVGTACAALAAVPMGRLVDRIGSRRVALGSLVALACGFALLGLATQGLASFLALTALLSLATAGSSPLPFTRLIVSAFARHRGLAIGIAMTGTGVGAILAPAVITPFVAAHGWRAGYLLLGLMVMAATAPVALLLCRAEAAAMPMPTPLAEILRDPAFLTIGLPVFLAATAILGTVVHFVPMLTDAGFSPERAGGCAALIGFSAIGGRLLIGVMLDRLAPALVAMGLFALAALGVAVLALSGAGLAVLCAVIIGLAVGAEGNLISLLTARHFLPARYGQAYGALYAVFLVGGALGPAAIGFLFDATGGYRAPLLLAAAALALGASLSLRILRLAQV